MSSPYFIRHQLGDTPGNNAGSFSACPDIVLSTNGAPDWVPQPLDPSTLCTPESYATEPGSTVQVSASGVANYVYLRALNTQGSSGVPPRFWFLYTESDLMLWPQRWKSSGVVVQNAPAVGRNWQDGALIHTGGPNDAYVVTSEAFLWTPPLPSGNQYDHYCMISMVEPFPDADPPGSLSSPPAAPPDSVGYLGTLDELTRFVLTNDWFGWRNAIDVSTFGSTWQHLVSIRGADVGQGQANIGISCTNMPTDGFVSVSMAGPDPANSISIPKSPISDPNLQLTVPVTLPANFDTTLVVSYWQGPTVPPYGANIVPMATVPDQKVAQLLDGRPSLRAPIDVPVLDPVTNELIRVERVHVIGAVPLVWNTPPHAG